MCRARCACVEGRIMFKSEVRSFAKRWVRPTVVLLVALGVALGLPSAVPAQPQPFIAPCPIPDTVVPVALEGTINAIDLSRHVITVMRVPVVIDRTTVIVTQSGAIISEPDLLGDPLPGRTVPGFTNARATLTGVYVDGVVHATRVYVEPSEDVLIGPATCGPGHISVLGRRVVITEDERMWGRATNENGFTIDPTSCPLGTPVEIIGYDTGDVFYAIEFVSDFAALTPANQTLITRAQCSPGGNFEVRGASTSQAGEVSVYDDVTNQLLGTAPVTANGASGEFRFRIAHPPTCPARVRVVNSNGSIAIALVTP